MSLMKLINSEIERGKGISFCLYAVQPTEKWLSYSSGTVQPAYKVVRIQGMSAYSVRSLGPDSCVCICDEIFIHIRNPLIRNFCF